VDCHGVGAAEVGVEGLVDRHLMARCRRPSAPPE
jgi:hypothetical protein